MRARTTPARAVVGAVGPGAIGPGAIGPGATLPGAVLLGGVLLAGCGPAAVSVEGRFEADALPDDTLFVWAVGEPERRAIRDGGFLLSELPPGAIDLRVGNAAGEVARVELREVPAGTEVELLALRRAGGSDLAFPERIRLRGASLIRVNGLRMAPLGSFPDPEATEGEVLARGAGGFPFLFRPLDDGLPDLSVWADEGTVVEDRAGEERRARDVVEGDTVALTGRVGEDGAVRASRVVLPERRSGDAARPPPSPTAPAAASPPTGEPAGPATDRDRGGPPGRPDPPGRGGPPRGRGPPPGRGPP